MKLGEIEQFFAAIWSAVVSLFVSLGLASSPTVPVYQGYVEGEFVLAAPVLGGSLSQIAVSRGDQVRAGELIYALEDTERAAAREQAAADLEQARSRLANLAKGKRESEIDILQAQIRQAELRLGLARQQLDRQRKLAESSAYSQEKFDQAKNDHDVQQARIAELSAQLDAARQSLGREDELRAAEAEVRAKEAALSQAEWRLDQMKVVAPVSGVVADVYFNVGEFVPTGQAVVSILPSANKKVRFFVPEAMLGSMPVGAALEINCDGCNSPIPARVTFVSAKAEYTPPVLYNRDNRERLVFMIEAHPLENGHILQPGQPVDVRPAGP